MKTKWDEILKENASEDHAKRVFASVRPELEQNRVNAKLKVPEKRWLFEALGFATVAAFAGIAFKSLGTDPSGEPSELSLAGVDLSIDAKDSSIASTLATDDLELFFDLDLLENLETLEEWEDT